MTDVNEMACFCATVPLADGVIAPQLFRTSIRPYSSTVNAIDPDKLELCLQVLADIESLPPEHPDAVAVRRATAGIFKTVKKARRHAKRDAVAAADRAVTAATATGAPGRIDDETAGPPAGVHRGRAPPRARCSGPRACYICKNRYTRGRRVLPPALPDCAALNRAKRDARTDLTGRRALLTGGRAKIGMYIALRLLRDGAHTTITTRFPNDAVRRFAAMPDSADWLHRLRIVGIDLRDPAQVVALADYGRRAGPARHPDQQRRADRAPLSRRLRALVAAERRPAATGPLPELVTFDHVSDAHPARRLTAAAAADRAHAPHALTALALTAGSRLAGPDRRGHRDRRRRPAARPRRRSTAGPSASTRSTRSSCSRCSCATRPRRSSWSAGCARRWPRRRPAASTSSTCRRWRASSAAATRGRGTRTPTWPRPR